MDKRKKKENQAFHMFCRKWGILPEDIILLTEEEQDFENQEEFEDERSENGGGEQ